MPRPVEIAAFVPTFFKALGKMAEPRMPSPDNLHAESQHERFRAGIERFNRGEFFECHEVLEALWLEAAGDDKVFLQGLIQTAVSFHHLRRGNLAGAARLLRAAIAKLARPSRWRDLITVEELLVALLPLADRLEAAQASPDAPAPQIHWPRRQ